jgi:hypothetical protein
MTCFLLQRNQAAAGGTAGTKGKQAKLAGDTYMGAQHCAYECPDSEQIITL